MILLYVTDCTLSMQQPSYSPLIGFLSSLLSARLTFTWILSLMRDIFKPYTDMPTLLCVNLCVCVCVISIYVHVIFVCVCMGRHMCVENRDQH